jgi:hypothetical protein
MSDKRYLVAAGRSLDYGANGEAEASHSYSGGSITDMHTNNTLWWHTDDSGLVPLYTLSKSTTTIVAGKDSVMSVELARHGTLKQSAPNWQIAALYDMRLHKILDLETAVRNHLHITQRVAIPGILSQDGTGFVAIVDQSPEEHRDVYLCRWTETSLGTCDKLSAHLSKGLIGIDFSSLNGAEYLFLHDTSNRTLLQFDLRGRLKGATKDIGCLWDNRDGCRSSDESGPAQVVVSNGRFLIIHSQSYDTAELAELNGTPRLSLPVAEDLKRAASTNTTSSFGYFWGKKHYYISRDQRKASIRIYRGDLP